MILSKYFCRMKAEIGGRSDSQSSKHHWISIRCNWGTRIWMQMIILSNIFSFKPYTCSLRRLVRMCMRFIFSCLFFHECLYPIRYEQVFKIQYQFNTGSIFPTYTQLVFTNTRGYKFDKLEENCLVRPTAMWQSTSNTRYVQCSSLYSKAEIPEHTRCLLFQCRYETVL